MSSKTPSFCRMLVCKEWNHEEWNCFVERNQLFEKFKAESRAWQEALDMLPPEAIAGKALRQYGIGKELARSEYAMEKMFYDWPLEEVPKLPVPGSDEYYHLRRLGDAYSEFVHEWTEERYEQAIASGSKLAFWDFILTYTEIFEPSPWDAVLGGNDDQPNPWDVVLGGTVFSC